MSEQTQQAPDAQQAAAAAAEADYDRAREQRIQELAKSFGVDLSKADEGAQPDPEEADGEVEAEAADESDDAHETVDEEALGAARTALKRSGWSDEELEGFSDEQLLALGEKFGTVVADRDRDAQQIKDARAVLESLTEEETEPKTTGQPVELPKDHLEKVRKALSVELGDANVDALVDLVKGSLEPVMKENAELRREMGVLVKAEQARQAEAKRVDISRHYPVLSKDDALWGRVVKTESQLRTVAKFRGDADARWRAAALLEVGKAPTDESPKPTPKPKAKPGSPFPSRGRRAKQDSAIGTPQTGREAARASFYHQIQNPTDWRGARRAGGFTS